MDANGLPGSADIIDWSYIGMRPPVTPVDARPLRQSWPMVRKYAGLRYLSPMTLPPQRQPSSLWNAYLGHRRRIDDEVRAATLPHFDDIVMAGIEDRATRDPGGPIASQHRDLLTLLGRADLHQSEAELRRARDVYDAAKRATFPAATAFTDHTQSLTGLTHNVSLGEVDLDLLRKFDLLAHGDPAFREFVSAMTATLQGVRSAPDVIAYNQFFESYAEALVLHFLRGRGIRTSRVKDVSSAPDFRCELADGREYFVEVKALDIVGGEIRHGQIMVEGLKPNIEIERQQRAGRRIASAESEIAPYRRAHDDADYDPRSIRRVIDTLREKSQQAFKTSQFSRGPTFALIVADRLILHGWKSALVPYFYEEHAGTGSVVSGQIWQAAFGTAGSPVMRSPDFEGAPGFDGHLERPGLYVDQGRAFPGVGLVVLQKSSSRRLSYGLRAPFPDTEGWASDDTEEALSNMCDAWNDQGNSRGYEFVKYEIEP